MSASAFVPYSLPAALVDRARTQLSDLLDAETIVRGYRYALDGRARIGAERRNGLEIELESVCFGSRPEPYRQHVVLSFDDAGVLDLVEGDCSCPMQADCKHVACVALVWFATRPPPVAATGRPGAGAVPRPGGGDLLSAPEPVVLPQEAQEWLRGLKRPAERAPDMPLKGECVCYFLGDEGRSLALVKARILKGRRLTAIVHASPDLGWVYAGREPPRYLGALDVPVFQAVVRLKMGHGLFSGWSLEGAAGREALERALATGRLRVMNDDRKWSAHSPARLELSLDDAGWLKRGPRVAATLHLVPGASGGLCWAARTGERTESRDANGAILGIPVSPPLYLDRARCEIGELDTGDAQGVAG
ncbi:MAG: hypothetical protein AAB295_00650, partial [Chloroflexota bacterium]